MKNILVINDFRDLGKSYFRPFEEMGEVTNDPEILNTAPLTVKMVVFTGGSDVTPELYDEQKNSRTYSNLARDQQERDVFYKAVEHKIPMAGICRGSQFLCVMSGGRLVQHLNGHAGSWHSMATHDGRTIKVNSTHHQMQLPPADAQVLAWADPKLSNVYEGRNGQELEPEKEFECVFYPRTKALGMQYHPETMDKDSEGMRYCQELVETLLLKK